MRTLNLKQLLDSLLPLRCAISLKGGRESTRLVKEYLQEAAIKINIEQLRGSINYDPLQHWSLTGNLEEDGFALLRDLVEMTDSAESFRAVTISSSHFHNSGASAAQELAFLLNSTVETIDRLSNLGLSAAQIFRNIRFEMSIGTSYFMEIAKLKALRALFTVLSRPYGLPNCTPGDAEIQSTSSLWDNTLVDPYVNMLRNTTEAMAAIVGGCNALCIHPHDVRLGSSANFARRISKNISIILKEESHLDKTLDPAAGSYYINKLTDQLTGKALELFKEVEKQGGYVASFSKGLMQERIETVKEKQDSLVSSRRKVYVGTNQYPNANEVVAPVAPASDVANEPPIKLLEVRSGAEKIETVRINTELYVERLGEKGRPVVLLALLGDHAAMRTARATFSAGFLGCGGFKITEGPTGDPDAVVEHAINARKAITVLCGADDDYVAHAVIFAQKLKDRHPNGLLILAGHPGEREAEFKAAGFDDFIHMRADLAKSLRNLQKKLNII